MPQTLQIEKSPYGDERADVKVSDKRFAVYFMEFCEDILLCALNIILMLFGLTLVNIRNHTPYDLLFAFESNGGQIFDSSVHLFNWDDFIIPSGSSKFISFGLFDNTPRLMLNCMALLYISTSASAPCFLFVKLSISG